MISDVSDALVDVIHQATPDLAPWVIHHSLSQGDAVAPTDSKGILALLAVEEHEHLRNAPLVEGVAGLVRPPLALRLHYLVTYWGVHDEAQQRLAKLEQLSPGDFAAVKRQTDILGAEFSSDEFLAQLEAEHRIKPEVREARGMGFMQ